MTDFDPAFLQTYIKEAAQRLSQRFKEAEVLTKTELQVMLAELHVLVGRLPEDPVAEVVAVADDSTPAPKPGDAGSEPKAAEPEPEDSGYGWF